MKIYQGEPIGFKFNIKDDDGSYLPSLAGMRFEALLAFMETKIVKTWNTENGTISIGVETIDGVQRGYASFSVSGTETAEYKVGNYLVELAKVLEDGRAIGKVCCAIRVEPALIKKGV